jgi:hypothetical protein
MWRLAPFRATKATILPSGEIAGDSSSPGDLKQVREVTVATYHDLAPQQRFRLPAPQTVRQPQLGPHRL